MRFAYEQCGLRQKYAGFLGRPAEDSRWEVLVRPMYLISGNGYEREIKGATLDLQSTPRILIRVTPVENHQYDITFLIDARIPESPVPAFIEVLTGKIAATSADLYSQLTLYVRDKKLVKKGKHLFFTPVLVVRARQVWVFQMDQPFEDEE
jgi:hypothetical protein